MQFLAYVLFVAGIVAADQFTKYLTVANIALYEDIPFIPGLLQLTYVQNTGAAFSSFEGQQWLFALIFVFFTGLVLWEYFKKPMGFTTLERWCIAAIYGGGLGNMIDRVRMGYVVDMIETTFIEFPVFNVADCFITCGCILMMIHLVLFNKEFWKDEKKK
ncbi:MAG: signal peptidase II [Oscillospiraceae bacterium]|nr:signal peptidase II [Oscillospiraceae bacterium]